MPIETLFYSDDEPSLGPSTRKRPDVYIEVRVSVGGKIRSYRSNTVLNANVNVGTRIDLILPLSLRQESVRRSPSTA